MASTDTQISGGGLSERAEALEAEMMRQLDAEVMVPWLGDVTRGLEGRVGPAKGRMLMGDDPRLPPMPEAPTLMDFYKNRVLIDRRGGTHLLQSAKLALTNGLPEKLVLACLLHDISVVCLIRADHGYWGAQLVAPYIDEEAAWAIQHHQCLRFFPDPDYGYEYPELYKKVFGEDYEVEPYVRQAAEHARNHKWYESARLVTVNDLYAFDPNMTVDIEEFTDIIGRNFKQPKEGLGFDGSPVAHMWRTIIWPNNFL